MTEQDNVGDAWRDMTTWWGTRPGAARALASVSMCCCVACLLCLTQVIPSSGMDELSLSTAMRDAKKDNIQAIVKDRGYRYTGNCPPIKRSYSEDERCSVNYAIDYECMRSTQVDSLFYAWESPPVKSRRLLGHATMGGRSQCRDEFEAWLLVSFTVDGQKLERCAKLTGIDGYNWPLDTSMNAAKQSIKQYDIGTHLKVWMARTDSHSIVGYGSLDLLEEKVSWLLGVYERSCFALGCFTVVGALTFAASLFLGLCSPVNLGPKYALVPANGDETLE